MESYSDFAALYDEFMEDVPYDEWCRCIVNKLRAYGIDEGIVLDLGCGTGEVTFRLQKEGYDMIGIDNSDDMLGIAQKKCQNDDSILFLCQDMREFELYGTVRAVVSVCDCVNYITDPNELVLVFKLVNNYLDPDGIVVFDFNTDVKYSQIGESTIAENREDASFIWENWYDEESKINEYDITFFVKEGKLYRKFEESHFQRGYSYEEMVNIIEQSGMEFLESFDADTKGAVTPLSERIVIIAREKGKK